MALLWLPSAVVVGVAAQLQITDHKTGATHKWKPNTEQQRLMEATSSGRWVYAAKPRQVGATTITQLDDMLWCAANDHAGNRVRAALYVDTEDKLREREAFARSVVGQLPDLFKGCDVNSDRVLFPKGSVLTFGTGSGKSEGRSGSFQRLHLSELPFWSNPLTYGALIPALSLDGQVIIETTLDVDAPNGALTRDLWRKPNRNQKVFFSVEDHAHEYRADPAIIGDDEWAWCQEQGFTRRDCAAWWLRVALPDVVAGDVTRLMREYPQHPEHMFTASASRWVPVTPAVTQPVDIIQCGPARVGIWRQPADTTQVVIAVDTGKGVDRDRSAVVVLDKRDHRLCAAFTSNTLDVLSFAAIVRGLWQHYTIPPPDKTAWGVVLHTLPPEVVVEDNGIGEAMCLELARIGVPIARLTTDEASKAEGLTLARNAIVDGRVYGPADLAEECDDLAKDERGNWKGRKDLLMAIGFGLIQCRKSPWQEPPAPRRQGYVDVEAMLAPETPEW
jgi:hypothetical protein